MALRTVQPQDLVGKTIQRIDTSAVNVIHLYFTDGTSLQLWTDIVFHNEGGAIAGIMVDDQELDASRQPVDEPASDPAVVFTLNFKTPDILRDLEDNSNEGTPGADQALELANKFVEYGEYIHLEFHTDTGEVKVLPVKNS